MATYLKRSSKLFERLAAVNNSSGNNNGGSSSSGRRAAAAVTRSATRESAEPSLRELICPVCRTILREPVTLPCAHNLCLRCLRGTVEHSSLSCPLCRQRVGSWLRNATKTESLVNTELWQLIRKRFPEELELAAGPSAADGPDLDSVFHTKKIISAAGEIRREYEAQLQLAEDEMRRQREKERLASEALIRKIQEEEEQQKLVQLAQDQLLAKTLARREIIDKTNHKNEHSSKASTVVNVDKLETGSNQAKSTFNQNMLVKTKDAMDARKNTNLTSKIKSERYTTNAKSSSTTTQKERSEMFTSQKPVPIHNAVTRVVTHQSRVNQPNNSTYAAALALVGSTSKIYGLQSKEELHVPSDVLSSKKKKLGVEVCVTTVEGEERIGSAESAGSHDSINQEIHHFKPIKALPRTPVRITLDGRQIDPKLIRVLPILKRVSNAVPKPPTPTHLKKIFGCSWSAFKRISRQQVILKDSLSIEQQHQGTKKTDKKSLEQQQLTRTTSKASKSLQQDLEERNTEVAFDSNKNYTKNVNKIVNGTKVNKKLNKEDQTDGSVKQSKRGGKLKNGLLPGHHKLKPETVSENIQQTIEVTQIDDGDEQFELPAVEVQANDPLAVTPKREPRPPSPMTEIVMENIAERIKRRKNAQTNDIPNAINPVASTQRLKKAKSKKTSTKGRRQKTKEPIAAATKSKLKAKTKTKKETKTTTITSQIKRLAARSYKRPRYSEDSESEQEIMDQEETEANEQQTELETNEVVNLDTDGSPSLPFLPPAKKRRKVTTSKKQKKVTPSTAAMSPNLANNSDGFPVANDANVNVDIISEQQRLECLAAQERQDRELALMLQESLNGVAGRTRRGVARIPTPLQNEVMHEPAYNSKKQTRAIKK